MKERQIACVLLVLVIAGFIYGTQRSYQELVKVRKAATKARGEAVAAETSATAARRSLDKLKQTTGELREFAKAWSPYVESVRSPQATEQRIIDLIKESEVFAASQRFELLDQKKAPLITRRLRAHITIEDDYGKTLNWMAKIENAIPVCRVASCRLQRGESGNDVRVELILDFPIIEESMPS